MTFYPSDPRFYVQREYQSRHQRNAAYSWRSFARDLKLSPSMLSEFLKGRYGLSRVKALQVASVLQLDESHSQHFIDLLEAEFHRSPTQRRLARLRLSQRVAQQTPRRSWEQMAALEVAALENGRVQEEAWCVKLPRACAEILRELQAQGELGLDLRPFHEITLAAGELSPLPALPADETLELHVFARVKTEMRSRLMRELQDAILNVLNTYVVEDADRVELFTLRLGPVYRRA